VGGKGSSVVQSSLFLKGKRRDSCRKLQRFGIRKLIKVLKLMRSGNWSKFISFVGKREEKISLFS